MNYTYLSHSSILKSLQDNLQRVRTGRVSPAIIEPIKVEAYGTMLSMMELATISSPEPRTIVITPFDKSMIRAISKAIEDAKIGVNPTDNGAGVILNFPPMTEENRKEQVKTIDKIQEEIKIQVRQQRQDILSKNEREFEAQNASEDTIKAFKADLQKEIDAINQEIEDACKAKAVEVMKI
jgi:ribosome recycling factor